MSGVPRHFRQLREGRTVPYTLVVTKKNAKVPALLPGFLAVPMNLEGDC